MVGDRDGRRNDQRAHREHRFRAYGKKTTKLRTPRRSSSTLVPSRCRPALNALALQSRQQILFTPEVAEGKTTPGVQGNLTADAALARLLAGTGLSSSRSSEGMILVNRVDVKEASPPRALKKRQTASANDKARSATPRNH